ncbi:hypothetical protein ACFE04_015379 [Oxalis oulophora]
MEKAVSTISNTAQPAVKVKHRCDKIILKQIELERLVTISVDDGVIVIKNSVNLSSFNSSFYVRCISQVAGYRCEAYCVWSQFMLRYSGYADSWFRREVRGFNPCSSATIRRFNWSSSCRDLCRQLCKCLRVKMWREGLTTPLASLSPATHGEFYFLSLLFLRDYDGMAQQGFYFIGKNLTDFLLEKFQELIGEHKAVPQEVEVVMGRKLQILLGANGCAYFPFEELCDRPLGAADYFGLFKKSHTLALDGIPIFGLHNRTTAYWFVTLVDVMYENKARLLCTAEGSPIDLFDKIVTIADAQHMAPRTASRSRRNDEADLCVDNELGFAKDRTISRLTELNSKEYLEQHAATVAEKKLTHGS